MTGTDAKTAVRAGIEMAAKVADNFADVTTDRVKWAAQRIAKEIRELLEDGATPRYEVDVLRRYQRCAMRIWDLFEHDPLPHDDPAHFFLERLESILDRGLLVPVTTWRQARGEECCHGTTGCVGLGEKHGC
jgi:hypothetical protein